MTERVLMDPDHPCTELHDPQQEAFGFYQLALGKLNQATKRGMNHDEIDRLQEAVNSAQREHQNRSKAWEDCTREHGHPDVRYG